MDTFYQILLIFIPGDPNDDTSALLQITVWRHKKLQPVGHFTNMDKL